MLMLIIQHKILPFKGGEIMNGNELIHYGVLGMKWGVRRKRNKSSNIEVVTNKKSVSELSDEELRRIINRHLMEKQYAQITAKQKSAGAKFVSEVLTKAAKKTATSYTAKYMIKGIDALIAEATKKASKAK